MKTAMLSASNTHSSIKTEYSLQSKWNIIFDKSPEWISFKPQLGLKVYPCYSCKNMFSSKLSFQDHVNRRVIIIKYKCHHCSNATFTFYNRCSFLLHARRHFTLAEGHVNLANIDINVLPIELAGFERHESIPFYYDEDEDIIEDGNFSNSQFYTPDDTEAGKQVVMLRPFNLVFHYTEGELNILMVLKQISANIPLCEFVSQEFNKRAKDPVKEVQKKKTAIINESLIETQIKQEPDIEEFTLPVISKIESLNEASVKKCTPCPECKSANEISLSSHFLGNNKPLDQSLVCQVCRYIASTKCSLSAHLRIHQCMAPFVCPDCGKSFTHFESLNKHMEAVCFHLLKQIRFRCPAPKCGKLFVSPNTYASHFVNHFQCQTQCNNCNVIFFCENEYLDHSQMHEVPCSTKTYTCMVCKMIPRLTEDKYTEHLKWHLQDRQRCVYIFICKYCRSYFRSTATYAVHRQRCTKSDKLSVVTYSNCQFCGQKIVFREKDITKTCSICKQINHGPNPHKIIVPEKKKVVCMLCKEEVPQEEKKTHSKMCKYNNPIVNIKAMSEESNDPDESTSNSDAESKPSTLDTSSDSQKLEDIPKKKRKRSIGPLSKCKKSSDTSLDLQAEKPVSFDGTYYCKLCSFNATDRVEFHTHIVTHRDVCTAYQCMECGECFVVKPSLLKHLLHYHKISDTTEYLAENDCYDKSAIEELENQANLVPGEHKGPFEENQCTICLDKFKDAVSLNTHFRTHGMAFLLKKNK